MARARDSSTVHLRRRAVLPTLVEARGSTLMTMTGIGPSGAARLLADVGDIHRFTDRDRVRLLERHRRPVGRLLR